MEKKKCKSRLRVQRRKVSKTNHIDHMVGKGPLILIASRPWRCPSQSSCPTPVRSTRHCGKDWQQKHGIGYSNSSAVVTQFALVVPFSIRKFEVVSECGIRKVAFLEVEGTLCPPTNLRELKVTNLEIPEGNHTKSPYKATFAILAIESSLSQGTLR